MSSFGPAARTTDSTGYGSGMTIVHVPGLGLDARSSSGLRRHLDVEVVELPGLGEQADRRARPTVDGLAGELLRRLPAGPVILLGHSQSCQVVAAAAVLGPAAVSGLVLIGPTTDPRARPLPVLASRWLRTAAHEPPWQVPTLVRQYARTGLRSMWRTLRAGLHDRIDQRLPGVEAPVVVVRGGYDRICPRDWAASLASLAPDGRLVELPDAGHMPVLTQPAAVAAIISELTADVRR
jgi:pimeloyl-ACP methyl ester carboxylesterase